VRRARKITRAARTDCFSKDKGVRRILFFVFLAAVALFRFLGMTRNSRPAGRVFGDPVILLMRLDIMLLNQERLKERCLLLVCW
jgi:hypothetical protein